jgi:DNA-binding GntR family transcriptional regulator
VIPARASDPSVSESPYPSLNRTDLTKQTYQVLKDRILRRQLQPGQRISVDEIAQHLGVSRTPVTDSLKRLAVEGLVEIVGRRGTFVSSLTALDVAELFDVRAIVELYAAQRILRDGKVDEFLRRTETLMEAMRHASESGDYRDYPAFMEADRDFHLVLVELTGNSRLSDVYAGLNVHIQVSRAHYLSTVEDALQALREHDAILAAFRSGDASAVEQSLSAHIHHVKTRILELLNPRGGQL